MGEPPCPDAGERVRLLEAEFSRGCYPLQPAGGLSSKEIQAKQEQLAQVRGESSGNLPGLPPRLLEDARLRGLSYVDYLLRNGLQNPASLREQAHYHRAATLLGGKEKA